jgi:Protein of unknown function (DUF2778)
MGVILVRAVTRSISAGVALLIVGYAVKSAGTPAGPAKAGLQVERPSTSVFGMIRRGIFGSRPPVGSQVSAHLGVRMASLEPDLDSGAAAGETETQLDAATLTTRRASFDERFASSFDERSASFDERSASFDERFASVDAPPREQDESVVFGGPVWPMALSDALQPTLRTFALPAQLHANGALPPNRAEHETAPPVVGKRTPEATTVTSLSPAPDSKKPVRVAEAVDEPISPPDADNRHTAIYDIAAHAVYLPNGERLEAHSGFGSGLDNPQSVGVKNRGATPPHIYELALRKQPFHGVRAIRLIPVGEGKMFGRDGLLAHSYMLGPNGQSNGCVSFSNYSAFLNAYLRGEVDRLVVVEHLATAPPQRAGLGWLPEALRNLFNPS